MKKTLLMAAAALFIGTAATAQYKYEFTVVKENPATPVKNQAKTGTCWCFATTSFIESELIRMGKGEHDLSEMFIVRHNYNKRIADNYYRAGKGNVNPGSLAHMHINAMAQHGLMPEEVYDGINYDSPTHNHDEMSTWIKTLSTQSVEMKKRIPEPMLQGLMDFYLGELPEKFTYKGKEYTAKSFYESLGLKASDYVEITSFTNHPFYQLVPVEVPDNWDHQMMYNVPLEDMMAIIDNAINTGYTVAWDGDLSNEPGYAMQHSIAVHTKDTLKRMKQVEYRATEMPVTQESRQRDYEAFETVDDHLEHIVGIAKDQEGVKYYKTKNSWGFTRNADGYHYISENYVKAKTISILVNKNSIPKAIRAKLGLK